MANGLDVVPLMNAFQAVEDAIHTIKPVRLKTATEKKLLNKLKDVSNRLSLALDLLENSQMTVEERDKAKSLIQQSNKCTSSILSQFIAMRPDDISDSMLILQQAISLAHKSQVALLKKL